MPLIRTPLAKCNSNGHRGLELSELERGCIIRMHDTSKKNAEIHRFYDHPYSTVKGAVDKDALRDDGHSISRSGAPKSWTLSEERRILRYVCRFLKDIYKVVIKACSIGIKKNTVKKILKLYSIKN
ncbi:hypothetical protein G7Y89_g5346 [Cudoniella acicularis]|uniref:Uncharacterized protein n=1 Tax=Cudoniella acicularis TaxID=354080 RepID=A0A8H4RMM4_9HELO|nr:hypothetical protein G7Y89_g5346 [Cudoniella acicularis]